MGVNTRVEWIGMGWYDSLGILSRKLSLRHIFLVQEHKFIPLVATHYHRVWFLGCNTKCVEELATEMLNSDLMC